MVPSVLRAIYRMHDSFGPAAVPLSSSVWVVKAEIMSATLCEFRAGVNRKSALPGHPATFETPRSAALRGAPQDEEGL
jgi:hypothetical protein